MIHPDFREATLPPGWRIEQHTQVASTNDLAKQQARAGAPAQLVIVADQQQSGRGRMGRSWIMPAGAGLPLSLLLRPRWLQPGDAYLLTMLAAVALCQAVEQVAALPALLKWPNDLLVAGPDGNLRKAAGILTELDIQAGMINWAVIGIGVNIAWQPVGLVDGRDLAQTATSLSAAAGSTVSRSAVLSALLVSFTDGLDQIRTGEHAQMVEAWRSRLATIGQAVTIRLPDRTIAGLAEGVDATGALLVRDQQGQLQAITAGDVEA